MKLQVDQLAQGVPGCPGDQESQLETDLWGPEWSSQASCSNHGQLNCVRMNWSFVSAVAAQHNRKVLTKNISTDRRQKSHFTGLHDRNSSAKLARLLHVQATFLLLWVFTKHLKGWIYRCCWDVGFEHFTSTMKPGRYRVILSRNPGCIFTHLPLWGEHM